MRRATRFLVQAGWKLLISDLGINPDQVLRLANLPSDLFSRKESFLTPAQYFQFWQAIEEAAGMPALPLKIGQVISAEAFDPPIFASLCSPNLNLALARLSNFKALIGPMLLTVEVGSVRTTVTLAHYGSEMPFPCGLAATELVFMTQLIRLGTRHRVVPLEVVLPTLPHPLEEYTHFFGVAPQKGKEIRLSFSALDAARPFLTANETMWEFFEAGLRKRLSDLDTTAKMSDRVKGVLLEELPAGQYSVEVVAKRLAVSTRTLQRQLREESTSFKDILNTTRQQLAQHYLGKPAIAQGEIAYLLGFQDVNSFTRAFKGWTGITPSSYRTEHATQMH
jgi:AraC-like DNA-binding protein